MDDAPLTADDVKSRVESDGIRFIRLWFTDVLGQLKSFSINSSELDDAFEGGMGFDGSSITGFNAIEESDMVAMPDPATFRLMPTGDGERDPLERRSGEAAVAQLGAKARVGAQRRRRAGEHPEEVGKLTAGSRRPAQDRGRRLRRRQVVMDVEPAHRSSHGVTADRGSTPLYADT